MTHKMDRRNALKITAGVGMGYWLGSCARIAPAQSPNEKLNLAFVGIGGRGRANLDGLAGENIVALCDVDDQRAGDAYEVYPTARKYKDFRKMLTDLENQIDGVVVSTPDHTHFHTALMALTMGKHLYCEKPLAHSVSEVRTLTDLASRKGVATQLGIQRHAQSNVHRVVELIQGGAIGKVTECHCWVDDDRGMPAATGPSSQIFAGLDWDLWLGPARDRPYSVDYVPYNWRFWWDFGTGETGNWGCHILDLPFWALDLKYPTHVSATGPARDPQRTPTSMTTRFIFPASGNREEVALHWSHAKNGPDIVRQHNLSAENNNTLFIGSAGMLLCGFDQLKLYPEEHFSTYQPPGQSIPDSPGFYQEWTQACKGGRQTTCHFDYSGPLTETVLLGNVAYRAGSEFTWDATHLKTRGNASAQPYVHSEFRNGWDPVSV